MPKIEHMFVLMLENRSYDNVFGYSGFKGKDPRNGSAVEANDLTKAGPYSLATREGRVDVSQKAAFRLKSPGPGHEFTDTLAVLCGLDLLPKGQDQIAEALDKDIFTCDGGQYPPILKDPNKFDYALAYDYEGGKPADVAQCFFPAQLPVLHALANEFLVCDNWFSSLPGPTWPNRFFAMCGSSGGLDHSPSDARSAEASSLRIDGFKFEHGSIFEKLKEDWLVVYGRDDFAQAGAIKNLECEIAGKRFILHDQLYSRLKAGTLKSKYIWIEPSYDGLAKFDFGSSMHPCGDVRWSEALVKSVYENIRQSKYWEKSVLLIVFDEHGGFFDHVVPPGPDAALKPGDKTLDSANDPNTKHNFEFDVLGPRVPAIIVSPWVEKGGVDHTCYDHTSIIKTASKFFNFQPDMGNRVDRAAAFDDVFKFRKPVRRDAPVTLPEPDWDSLSKLKWQAFNLVQRVACFSWLMSWVYEFILPHKPESSEGGFVSLAARTRIERIRKVNPKIAAEMEKEVRALQPEKIDEYLREKVRIHSRYYRNGSHG